MDNDTFTRNRLLSIILGLIQVSLIGFLAFPQNLQATIFFGTIFIFLWLSLSHLQQKNPFLKIITVLGFILSIGFFFTTNNLVIIFSLLGIFTSIFLILITINFGDAYLSSGPLLIKGCYKLIVKFLIEFLTLQNLKKFLSLKMPKDKKFSLKSEVVSGLIFAIPVLIFFHIFFSVINQEYAIFIRDIFKQIWSLITNIWIYIKYLPQILISAYFFFSLVSKSNDEEIKTNLNQGSKESPLNTSLVILTATIILFFIFSFFQTKLLFINLETLPFKKLSTYTQQGFWELLVVAVIGYVLLLLIIQQAKDVLGKWSKAVQLIIIFNTELLLITVFSDHKLYALQSLFGLKDQRILATLAVLLISFTFVLNVLRIFGKITSQKVLQTQIVALLVILIGVNIVNLDLFVTKINPISYYVEEKKYKDYSYLFGNSYDNYSQWLNLIQEAKANQCIPIPKDYYWGNYKAIRTRDFLNYRKTRSYLRDKYNKLTKKYNELLLNDSLKIKTTFNFNEYQTYLLMNKNKKVFEEFQTFAETPCLSEPNTD